MRIINFQMDRDLDRLEAYLRTRYFEHFTADMTSSTGSARRKRTKAEKGLRIIYFSRKTRKKSLPVSFRMEKTFM